MRKIVNNNIFWQRKENDSQKAHVNQLKNRNVSKIVFWKGYFLKQIIRFSVGNLKYVSMRIYSNWSMRDENRMRTGEEWQSCGYWSGNQLATWTWETLIRYTQDACTFFCLMSKEIISLFALIRTVTCRHH